MPVSQRPRRKQPARSPWPKPPWRAAFMEYAIIAWVLAMIGALIVGQWL